MIYGSTEYVKVAVTSDVDVTGDAVNMVLMPIGQEPDQDTTWHPAEWDPDQAKYPQTARLLVGKVNGAIDYPKGRYTVYVDVVANPEVPWLRSGAWVIE